jgi:hypothetical protein
VGGRLRSDRPQAGRANGADVGNHRREVQCVPVSVARDGRPERCAGLSSPSERLGAVRVAEPHTPRLSRRQGLLRPFGGCLALLLRHERHDPDGEVVRLWQVHGGEAHPVVPERQQEGGVARQPVELGDHQGCSGDLSEVQSLRQLRPVRTAPALHFGEAGQDRRTPRLGVALDRLALRRDAEPARALARRGDPLVGDDAHLDSPVQNCQTFVAQFCTLSRAGSERLSYSSFTILLLERPASGSWTPRSPCRQGEPRSNAIGKLLPSDPVGSACPGQAERLRGRLPAINSMQSQVMSRS